MTKGLVNHRPILMQKQDIEPVFFVPRHEHSNSITPQLVMHSRIFDVADSIQSEIRVSFAEEDGAYRYTGAGVFRIGHREVKLAHVINKS
jgi:hypothetical protein